MFRNISIFTILLFSILSTSNAQLINNKEFRLKETKQSFIELSKPVDSISKSSIVKNKSPLLAGTLSFIVPGAALGQLYNGQYVNFGIRFGISAISIIGIAVTGIPFGNGQLNDAFIPLVILLSANWISSIFDAVIYNQKQLCRE